MLLWTDQLNQACRRINRVDYDGCANKLVQLTFYGAAWVLTFLTLSLMAGVGKAKAKDVGSVGMGKKARIRLANTFNKRSVKPAQYTALLASTCFAVAAVGAVTPESYQYIGIAVSLFASVIGLMTGDEVGRAFYTLAGTAVMANVANGILLYGYMASIGADVLA